jgi:hypothetical protein
MDKAQLATEHFRIERHERDVASRAKQVSVFSLLIRRPPRNTKMRCDIQQLGTQMLAGKANQEPRQLHGLFHQ